MGTDGLAADRFARRGEPAMVDEGRVYYPLRRGVSVTEMRLRAQGRVYDITGLSDLGEGALSGPVQRRVAMYVAALEAVVPIGILLAMPSPAITLAAVAYLVAGTITVWVGVHRWPRPLQLSALYKGEPVVLYVSTNHTEFRQICRALVRATEGHRRSY